MSSREKILQAIKAAQVPFQPLPEPIGFSAPDSDLLVRFRTVLEAIGGRVEEVSSLAEAETWLRTSFDLSKPVMSLVEDLVIGAGRPGAADDPHRFEHLELVVLRAQLGVAENGAVWVGEEQMVVRALPFITQHLAVVLYQKDLVPTMHQAYERLPFPERYGVFIAGPSKTADIEQSLVIGAHGPRSMTVLVVRTP